MKCSIIKDNERREVVIYTDKRSTLVEEIKKLCEAEGNELMAYKNGDRIPLTPMEVQCFTVEDGHVYALTAKDKLVIKDRLYKLEEALPDYFVKINQSCLANIKAIARFEATVGASLSVLFKNGHRDYVSRRQLKQVKERMGIK